MDDRVDGEQQAAAHDLFRQRLLAGVSALVAGDVVGGSGLGVLDRNLHVVEAGFHQIAEGARGDANRRGDEVGVKACVMRGGCDLHKVAARGRLATGKRHLQHTEAGGLAHHPHPGGRVELVAAFVELERIRAVGTAERATVGQLGEHAERPVQRFAAAHVKAPGASCRPARAAVRSRRQGCARAAPKMSSRARRRSPRRSPPRCSA